MLFEGHVVGELVPWAFDWPRDVVARCFWANMGFRARPGDQCPTGSMTKDLHNPTLVVLQKKGRPLHVEARTAPQNLRQSYSEQKAPGNATVEHAARFHPVVSACA